ncbi:Ankyrin repeat, PH and SEC7 domain containing protein secG [Fusarium odoratissimum]|uniref:Ankyrin repeat, PH and SEC7 domain containing protein secG n=1 Tax=Fusarium oxysporum f. sp. cubense (strain race 4) TaxID=2502994 RepID=N1RIC1_FUSC4|nr:Ankyrin repeat, PH and SEC7 domain containing protein secG [Fusarium odoratissimum]
MEVLGAVASSIAVVQALAAGKHAVSLLNMIKSMAQAVSRMAPTALEQDLINTAARNLNEITAELEALLRICSHESGPVGNKMNKARKRKWLVEKSDIKKLQQRMIQAKETLHFALNSSRVSNDIRNETDYDEHANDAYKLAKSATSSSATTGNHRESSTSSTTSHAGADVTSLRVNIKALGGCTHSLGPGLICVPENGVPGSEMVSHRDIQDLSIENDSMVWINQEGSSQVVRRSVAVYGIYPHDTDIRGMGLMEYSLDQQLYSSLEALLDIWKNILTEVGLPRRVAMAAAISLRDYELNDNETYLVKNVLGFSRDPTEAATTKVHKAILQCADLQEVLQEQPWAVNTIDDTGDSPLYLATDKKQVRSMEVLISAGADVNQQSFKGWTPLMAAVWQQNVESVNLLLKSKSNVNLCNDQGMTALHWALMKANPEVTSLLLAAGASVKHRNMYGDTPLHSLVGSTNTTHQDIEAAIEMLLVAGSDLEARNNLGITPFLLSIHHNKLEFTRGLVKSHCSVHVFNDYSQNVLHLAARYASLELLWYLSVLDLSGINPYQEDSFGDTPFDDLVRNSHATGGWDLGDSRRPSLAEQEAFVELYQGVRDQALQNDIQNLERVLGALQEQDIAVAREHLAMLIRKEKRWERGNLVSWYRALDKRIQHAEWELATEDIDGHLLDLQEELATSVWEIPSKYGYLWEFDDGESASEEVSESEDRSEKLYDSDQQVVHEDDAQAA